MKKAIFVAMAFVAVAGGAFAFQKSTVAAPKADVVYTYYLDSDCDRAIECSPEFTGNICSEEFNGSIVYNQPGCELAHQTTNIIGRKQP